MQTIAPINTKAVTKSRFIVRESYALSLAEHRLILSCISKIDRTKGVPDEIVITVEEFKRDWPEMTSNIYREMKSATENLWQSIISCDESQYYSATQPNAVSRHVYAAQRNNRCMLE